MIVKHFPELDGSPELNSNDTTWYQEIIGVLHWSTELGRVDILNDVSILSQYQCSPREGYIQELLKIFAFLRSHPKLMLYFDPKLPNLNYEDFVDNSEDFSEIYRDAQEDLHFDIPKPRGLPVTTLRFADTSFSANRKTRRSHSGYLLFVDRALIVWYSKKQSMVEDSAFSAEFIALKVCTKAVKHLRFKLRSFVIPLMHKDGINHGTCVYCDNQSVINNTTNVELVLNKKSCSVAYYYVRSAVVSNI